MLPGLSSLDRQLSARVQALPWRVVLPWIGAVFVVAWFGATALRAAWHFTIDDSGISFAYAKHIADGDGAVAAIGGPRVEGYSNALWVFLLVPFSWLGLPLPAVSKVLGVLGLMLTLWAGFGLLLRTRPKQPVDALLLAFWGVGMVVSLEIVVWTVAGLENALLSALLMGMLYFDAKEHDSPTRFPVSAVLGFLLCITRPEGPAYALPILALKTAVAWRKPSLRSQLKLALVWFLVPLVVYHVIHFAVFREFVPNTYFAKPQSKSLSKGLEYLRKSLRDSRLLIVLPLALVGVWGHWRHKITLLWVAMFGALFVLYSGGDWMPHARFISFFAPALLLLATHGVHNCAVGIAILVRLLGDRVSSSRRMSNPALPHWVAVGVLCLTTLGCGYAWQSVQLARLQKVKQAKFCHFCERLDDSKKLQALSTTANIGAVSVVTHDFGGPSWQSNEDYYPIDFLGLCDATIPRLRNARSSLRFNYPLFAHVLHEQANGPSWIYLPRHFWPGLKELTESNLAYLHLNPNQLPHAPAGGYLDLHRRELVDFFPPFADQTWQEVTPGTKLIGAEVTTTPEALKPVAASKGAKVRVSLAMVGNFATAGGRVGITFGNEPPKQTLPIDRGLGVAQQFASGEPLRFDFDLVLPAPRGDQYQLRLGYSKASKGRKPSREDWTYVELETLNAKSRVPLAERAVDRYPNALPSAVDEALLQLEPKVATLLDLPITKVMERRQALAAELIARGQELEQSNVVQAYLSYVWATQIHPPSWSELTKPLLRLRPTLNVADFGLEVLLLRDHYANPSVESKARLVEFYVSRNKHHQAKYFGQEPQGESSPKRSTALQLTPKALKEWHGALQAVAVPGTQLELRTLLPGFVLTTDVTGNKAQRQRPTQGELLSPPFELDGSRLSLMVAGGKLSDRVGVELLVDDQVVFKASGASDSDFFPVVWDVSSYRGKSGQLKVFDRSNRKSLYVGGLELWK